MDAPDPIAAAWLVVRFSINLVIPLVVQSRIDGCEKTKLGDDIRAKTYTGSMLPSANLLGHLKFHLKTR